jgi:hypothetical protein
MPFVRGHYRRTPAGYAFVPPHYRRGSGGYGGSGSGGLPDSGNFGVLAVLALGLLGIVVFVLVSITRVIKDHLFEVFAVLSSVVVTAVVVFIVSELRKWRIHAYLDLCRMLATEGTLEPERLRKMEALATKLPVGSQLRQLEEEAIYRDMIARILADGRIDEQERSVLRQLENAFVFDVGHAASMKLDAFTSLVAALRGHMDEGQEQHVRATARDLALDSKDVEEHLRPLIEYREHVQRQRQEEADRLANAARFAAEQQAEHERATAMQREQREHELAEQARLRSEQEAKLERDYLLSTEVRESVTRNQVAVTLRIPSTESPWCETPAAHLKRFKKGDQREVGTLLVTSRRLLFAGDSTITIRLDKILDVAVDIEHGTLRVIKEGRKQPFFFEVDQPLVVLAHVERSLEELA